jgi:hypothetical protein
LQQTSNHVTRFFPPSVSNGAKWNQSPGSTFSGGLLQVTKDF